MSGRAGQVAEKGVELGRGEEKKKKTKGHNMFAFLKRLRQVMTSSGFSFTVVVNNACVSMKPFQHAL